MADNINVTQGSGTIIATDDVAGVHMQKVKVDLGGNGASAPLGFGQAANAASIPVTLSTEQAAYLDGIETLITSTNTKLDTAIGHVDGLETLIGSTNTAIGTVNTNLTTVIGHVDGLEASLTTITGHVDGLETLIGSTNTKLDTVHADLDRTNYETVAAAATDQVLGATGAVGDVIERVIIIPANTSPGAVSVKDGGGSAITIFAGGAASVADLSPIFVTLGMKSVSGAWSITTGADVSAIGVGRFTA